VKILLAEDDLSIQLVAKLSLQKIGGHEVTVAANGQEAFEKAQTDNFDLIILDGMMPLMDGFTTCRELKSHPKTKDMPVIFLTAKNTQADIDEGYTAGGIGYISKPFDARELCNEINKIYSKILWKQSA
jgi:CheY-like chemotaxis protein